MKYPIKKILGLFLGLGALCVFPFCEFSGLSPAGHITLGIFVFAAIFWITEPIPIYVTSLAVIFFQVTLLSDQSIFLDAITRLSGGEYAAPNYQDFYGTLAHPILILFLGGFSLAKAAEKYALDRNLTRILLKPFGSSPTRVALGVMLVTGILSAFMSNTATTAMMMTVALPIVAKVPASDPFRRLVALSIPVGANIGGIATPIGTPPNAVAIAALAKQGTMVPFSTWMMIATPLVLLALVVSWLGMCRMFKPQLERFELNIDGQFKTSPRAIGLYIVFALTVGLWVTEKMHHIPSAVVAFLPMVMLPALGILDKQDIRSHAWEVLWLVAGGISLGISLRNTGLAEWMISLVSWEAFSPFMLILLFALVGFSVGNLISHTVSATILVPIAIAMLAPDVSAGPAELIIPIAVIGIIVSFAMILPISTPPNAIALSTGLIETKDLAKAGWLVGIVGIILTLLFGLFIWPILL
ncbi:DASS family sodium-coupled anion symporter [Kiritimatiellaeota bacterium B1221]|nr:DASS family sodium-coupled anion symporter [Kiritimatiellaeota bacterium B1221]